MKITPTAISDVLLIEPDVHRDDRGSLFEMWNGPAMAEAGIHVAFAQDNFTWSGRPGVIRALHFQTPPSTQGKFVTCLTGAIHDVAVDLRAGSPTYGRHVSAVLRENGAQIWIPAGFAHGYCTLEPDCRVHYKLTAPFAPDLMGGLCWDDPDLAIDWPVAPEDAIVSERDRSWAPFARFETPFGGE